MWRWFEIVIGPLWRWICKWPTVTLEWSWLRGDSAVCGLIPSCEHVYLCSVINVIFPFVSTQLLYKVNLKQTEVVVEVYFLRLYYFSNTTLPTLSVFLRFTVRRRWDKYCRLTIGGSAVSELWTTWFFIMDILYVCLVAEFIIYSAKNSYASWKLLWWTILLRIWDFTFFMPGYGWMWTWQLGQLRLNFEHNNWCPISQHATLMCDIFHLV